MVTVLGSDSSIVYSCNIFVFLPNMKTPGDDESPSTEGSDGNEPLKINDKIGKIAMKRPKIDESEAYAKLAAGPCGTSSCGDQHTEKETKSLEDSSDIFHEFLFHHSLSSAKKCNTDDDYTSDAEEYPLYTQPTEGTRIIPDSQPSVHLIIDEEGLRKLGESSRNIRPLSGPNQNDDGNVKLDRIWLSPPNHRKVPRVGSSFQANVMMPLSDQEQR